MHEIFWQYQFLVATPTTTARMISSPFIRTASCARTTLLTPYATSLCITKIVHNTRGAGSLRYRESTPALDRRTLIRITVKDSFPDHPVSQVNSISYGLATGKCGGNL